MRAPTRILVLSLLFCTILVVFFVQPSTVKSVTHNLDVRVKVRELWRQAQSQAHLGAAWSSTYITSNTKSFSHGTHGASADNTKDIKVTNDGSTSTSDSPPGQSSDEDRDAFRGFTDAEQAEARARLEFKYGNAAKEDLSQDMDSTKAAIGGISPDTPAPDPSWDSGPAEVMDREKAKAQSILEGMFGAETPAVPKGDKPEPTEEVGWRTTALNTGVANRTHTPAAFITANANPVLGDSLPDLLTTLTTRKHATTPADVPDEYATTSRTSLTSSATVAS